MLGKLKLVMMLVRSVDFELVNYSNLFTYIRTNNKLPKYSYFILNTTLVGRIEILGRTLCKNEAPNAITFRFYRGLNFQNAHISSYG